MHQLVLVLISFALISCALFSRGVQPDLHFESPQTSERRSPAAEPVQAPSDPREKLDLALDRAIEVISAAEARCPSMLTNPEVRFHPEKRAEVCPSIQRAKLILLDQRRKPIALTKNCGDGTGAGSFLAQIENRQQITWCESLVAELQLNRIRNTWLHEAGHLADYVYWSTFNRELRECWANEILYFSLLFSGRYPVITDDYPERYFCWGFVGRMANSIVSALGQTEVRAGMNIVVSKGVRHDQKFSDAEFDYQYCKIKFEPAVQGEAKNNLKGTVSSIKMNSFAQNGSVKFDPTLVLNLDFGPGPKATLSCHSDFIEWSSEKIAQVSDGAIILSTPRR